MTAALRIMVDVARGMDGVDIIRASVNPDNAISRRTVERQGLKQVGQKVYEKRGVENIFEMDVKSV
jgi:[ribosomal protein S5]-alanine N-acetyltransferase